MKIEEVLSGNAGQAGAQWVLRGKPFRRRLRAAVQGMLEPGWEAGVFRLRRAKFKPGRDLKAYFDVEIWPAGKRKAAGEKSIRPVAVRWKLEPAHPASGPEAEDAAQAEIIQRGLAAPFQRLQADLPEWGMRIRVSPLDPGFSQLARISDPAYIGDMLRGAGLPGIAEDSVYTATAVRYRPGERHVLRYEPLGQPGPAGAGVLYAKLYREPEAAARAGRIAMRVADWLDANGSRLIAVRPAVVIPPEAVVIYPRVTGTPLSRLLRRPGRDLCQVLHAAGSGLRELHNGPPSLAAELEANPMEKEIRLTARANEHIRALLPAEYARVQEILERVSGLLAGLPQEEPGFTHSDFKADHVLVRPQGLALIDFDTCSLADPALDVGKFLADLDYWFANFGLEDPEPVQEQFLAGYAGSAPGGLGSLADRLARARAYHALVLLKITARRVRIFDPHWRQLTTRLMRRAEQVSLEAASRWSTPADKTAA